MPTLVNSFPNTAGIVGPIHIDLARPTGAPTSVHLLLIQVNCSTDTIVTPPPGFSLVPGASVVSANLSIRIFQKMGGSSEPDFYRVYAPEGVIFSAGITAIIPTTLIYPVVHVVATNSSDVTTTNKVWNEVNNVDANTLLLCFGAFVTGSGSTPHAGMTERWDSSSASTRPYLMTQSIVGTGLTGTRTATGASVTRYRTVTLSISETDTPPASTESPELNATEISVLVELSGEGAQVTQLGVFTELSGEGIQITQFGTLAEIGALGIYVTSMAVLVEFERTIATGIYAVADGHNIPSSYLLPLNPQPSIQGQFITRRNHSPNSKLLDEFKYTYHQYNVIKSIAQYRSILDQYGLLTAETNEISISGKDEKYGWGIYNGKALRPELGEDVQFNRFFIRNLRIYITELELHA